MRLSIFLDIIILCLFGSWSMYGQLLDSIQHDSLENKPLLTKKYQKNSLLTEIGNDYKKTYKKVFALESFFSRQSLGVILVNDNYTAIYTPNKTSKAGLGIYYSWITARFQFDSPIGFKKNLGKSSFLSFDARLFIKEVFMGYFSTSSNKGYNLIGYEGSVPNTLSTVYDNGSTNSLAAYIYYIPNGKKYSIKSFFTPLEVQKKSAGSLFISALYAVNKFSENSADTTSENVLRNHGVSVGYGYNLIFLKKFFVSGIVNIGPNYIISLNKNTSINKIGINNSMFFSVGYNGERSAFGLWANYSSVIYVITGSSNVHYLEGFIRLSYTYRFDVRKSKVFDKIDRFTPNFLKK